MDEALRQIRHAEGGLYAHRRRVRFQDVDAAGVVFYVRAFDYFHDAYVEFLRDRGAPLEDAVRDRSWIAPLRRAEAEYLSPLHFGDEIDVVLVSLELEDTEYSIGYRIERDGAPMVVGRTRHVSVHPETFRRTELPAILRRALSPG